MAEIVGTITNLSDFLSKTQVCLSVKPNDPQQQIICLEADRKYSIPAFQREVRWDDNNLKMLLYDLSRSSKFLGNIILTIKSDHTCEIIDGQQRTTVLMLIVSCIKKKFGTKISTPDLCPLRNEGFTGFQTLLEKAFDQEAITSDDWNAILKSDDYHQLPRIQKLWNTISSSELLADRHKAQGLLDNLCKSEFNIIASYSNDVNTSIQYFLDVNLKGIRLDTEDIFKGYLFSQDSRELTRSLWQKNKRDVLRLNGVTQSSEEKRYPLMKLYEHFFYCDLYLPREGDCEYSTLKFGENFCLTSGFESGSTKYYEGSHLIEAIRDRDYLQNVLSRLNKCVEIMTDIIESEGPSTPFKDKFILILVVLAIINKFVGDDTIGTVIILAIGFVSALIKFAQNYSTYKFNRKLKSEMFSTATVVRNGKEQTIRTEKVVKGDIIHLNAGSIIPADVMIIENKDLFLNQSVFTGESAPIEKTNKFNDSNEIFSLSNICLMGTSVISGKATALVINTGFSTYLGSMGKQIDNKRETTNFEKGMNNITKLLIKYII